MYYIILYGLIILSLYEIGTGKKVIFLFNCFYLLLSFVAIFRYGQLADYFAYSYLYYSPEVMATKELLFYLLSKAFRYIGFDYTIFSAFISGAIMLLSYPFFRKICRASAISLLVFYAYIFQMCVMGAVRQGICVALLLYLYYCYKEKGANWFLFGGVWLFGCLIHLSFVFAIFIPLAMKLSYYNRKVIFLIVPVVIIIAFIGFDLTNMLLPFLRAKASDYSDIAGQSVVFQVILRTLLILPLLIFYPRQETDGYYAKGICIVGFFLYCIAAGNNFMAGRIEYYYRVFYCLIAATISMAVMNRKIKQILLLYIVVLHTFIWFKNIDFAIENGNYRNDVTIFNFPYISIFDKSEIREKAVVEREMLPYL